MSRASTPVRTLVEKEQKEREAKDARRLAKANERKKKRAIARADRASRRIVDESGEHAPGQWPGFEPCRPLPPRAPAASRREPCRAEKQGPRPTIPPAVHLIPPAVNLEGDTEAEETEGEGSAVGSVASSTNTAAKSGREHPKAGLLTGYDSAAESFRALPQACRCRRRLRLCEIDRLRSPRRLA